MRGADYHLAERGLVSSSTLIPDPGNAGVGKFIVCFITAWVFHAVFLFFLRGIQSLYLMLRM